MCTFFRLSKIRVIIIMSLTIVVNHYMVAQSNITVSDKPKEYINHKKESLLDHLIESKKSKLEIETNFDELFKDRRNQKYKQAIATFTFENNETWTDSLRVKVRGKFRALYCDYPPIKIKYSKKKLKKRGFKKRNEYKLVYPCKGSFEYQNYIYKEYLIYKMYNELTDKSLRVHLVDLTLKDVARKKEIFKAVGFLTEHREELIKRLDAFENEFRCLPFINKVIPPEQTILEVFQFMIGNVDWVIENCKNVEIIQLQDSTVIPIPYDFDYTGLVNPYYAKPSSKFDQETLKDRYFIGTKKSLEELEPVLELFKEKKKTFFKIINDFDYLPKKERKSMINYLKSFYWILDHPSQVKKKFIRK